MLPKLPRNRLLSAAAALSVLSTVMGCSQVPEGIQNTPKNILDYMNLRNGLLDPSQVGRFDKANPWGTAKPVTWPILDQLDVIDETPDRWASATDPLPSDVVTDTKEYVVGEGDLMRISVFELVTPGLEYYKDVQVNELGNVTLQNINQVHVSGLTPSQIEEKIGQIAVERGFLLPKGNGNAGPQVSVTLQQSRSRIFSILGQVSQPGTYSIIGTDFRVLDALALARDIAGGAQPGMDYMYVIRTPKNAGVVPAQSTAPTDNGTSPTNAVAPTVPAPTTPATPTAPATHNPLDALDQIEKGTTTQPTSEPGKPGADGPQYLRPLPTAVVMSASNSGVALAQADLDAALGGVKPATSAPATAPAVSDAATAPAAVTPATTEPSTAGTAAPASNPANDTMLNQAVTGSTTKPGFIFVDGKWVQVDRSEATPAAATQPSEMSHAEAVAAASGMSAARVIRIPIDALKEGNSKYNIVIQSGDVINVPNIEPGEFYMMGHVNRQGVYSLTGRKVTLEQAVAAAGGLDAVAIPRRCDLIRRIGNNQQVIVQVDLQRIFDGEQPDIFLKANDMVNIGTDAVASFLAVTRNAYRASYGWGFVYDKNYYIQPQRIQ
jgi:protein involved in polysaccharide export with SLBB domain